MFYLYVREWSHLLASNPSYVNSLNPNILSFFFAVKLGTQLQVYGPDEPARSAAVAAAMLPHTWYCLLLYKKYQAPFHSAHLKGQVSCCLIKWQDVPQHIPEHL